MKENDKINNNEMKIMKIIILIMKIIIIMNKY